MKKQKGIFTNCILLLLLLAILYSGLQILEATVLHPDREQGELATEKTIQKDGVDYFPNQDQIVMMVLGIDRSGPVESSRYFRNPGVADSILLLIFDERREECTLLNLNRDTMVHMDVLGVRGEYAGTAYGQLALAYTYGEGLKDSCENVKSTLEKFLHGLTIDCYVAMHMDALPILNDAVGGVTVTVEEDFSLVNPTITLGEVTLKGDQVTDFLRSRKDVGDELNTTRMARQSQYVERFLEALGEKKYRDVHFFADIYEDITPYIVTDCSVETLSGMLSRYAGYTLKEIVSPEGESIEAKGHKEFHVDKEKLEALILRLLYRETDF